MDGILRTTSLRLFSVLTWSRVHVLDLPLAEQMDLCSVSLRLRGIASPPEAAANITDDIRTESVLSTIWG
jgi:hypothetical protein